MELRGLCAVLAWLQILPQPVSLEAPDSSPALSVPEEPLCPALKLHPPGPRYPVGASVTLTCSAPVRATLLGFWFFHGTMDMRVVGASPKASRSYQIPQLSPQHTGLYTCRYWIEEGSQKTPSPESRPVSITVTDPLPPPTLSLGSQAPVYYQGERLNLSCSAPSGKAVTGYRFYSGSRGQTPEKLPSPSGAPWLELRAVTGAEGPYTCQYWRMESGQEFPSRDSNEIYVTVRAAPASPTLSLHPPQPLYISGEHVTLRCSAPEGQRPQGYRFYGEQERLIQRGVPAPDRVAQLEVVAETGRAGTYTCAYWSLRSGRQILSERSRTVSLSVQDHPPKPSVSLSPDKLAYVSGDRVEIRCSAPPGVSPERFGFYQSGKAIGQMLGNSSHWQMDLLANGILNTTRSFSCIYEQLIQGRAVPSRASDPISTSVFPALAAPSLRLSPTHPIYVTGERVTVECVVPAGTYEPQGTWLWRDEEVITENLGPELVLSITFSNRGTYRCGYSTELRGHHLQSPPSKPVPLSVTDLPPQAVLSVDPRSMVLSEESRLLIACETSWSGRVRRFHFWKDGVEIPGDVGSGTDFSEPSTGLRNVSILSISQANSSITGEFTCGYEENIDGRWVPSLMSQAVNIIMIKTDSPSSNQGWMPLMAGCVGAVVLLSSLLLICLCRRRRKGAAGGHVAEPTEPVYVNSSFGAGTALQQRSHDGQVQLLTHNQPAQINKPGVCKKPQKRFRREENTDTKAECNLLVNNTIYSMWTPPPSTVAPQRGHSSVLETVVYSEIP